MAFRDRPYLPIYVQDLLTYESLTSRFMATEEAVNKAIELLNVTYGKL